METSHEKFMKTDAQAPVEGRAAGEVDDLTVLHISNLTRNVKSSHLEEIFGHYGPVKVVDLQVDKNVGLSKGFAYLTYLNGKDAEQAVLYLDGGQIDGNVIKVSFVLVSKKGRGRDDYTEADRSQKNCDDGSDGSRLFSTSDRVKNRLDYDGRDGRGCTNDGGRGSGQRERRDGYLRGRDDFGDRGRGVRGSASMDIYGPTAGGGGSHSRVTESVRNRDREWHRNRDSQIIGRDRGSSRDRRLPRRSPPQPPRHRDDRDIERERERHRRVRSSRDRSRSRGGGGGRRERSRSRGRAYSSSRERDHGDRGRSPPRRSRSSSADDSSNDSDSSGERRRKRSDSEDSSSSGSSESSRSTKA